MTPRPATKEKAMSDVEALTRENSHLANRLAQAEAAFATAREERDAHQGLARNRAFQIGALKLERDTARQQLQEKEAEVERLRLQADFDNGLRSQLSSKGLQLVTAEARITALESELRDARWLLDFARGHLAEGSKQRVAIGKFLAAAPAQEGEQSERHAFVGHEDGSYLCGVLGTCHAMDCGKPASDPVHEQSAEPPSQCDCEYDYGRTGRKGHHADCAIYPQPPAPVAGTVLCWCNQVRHPHTSGCTTTTLAAPDPVKPKEGECGDPVPGLKPSLVCTMPKGHEGTHGTDGVVWNRMTVEFRNGNLGRND